MTQRLALFTRFSLFLIYFWLGALKVFNLSPAEELVAALYSKTVGFWLPFFSFDAFYILFALFECFIGVLYLIKGMEKNAMILTILHIFTTALPLIFLPEYTWAGFMIPTMTGQYILKNLMILALSFTLYEHSQIKKTT